MRTIPIHVLGLAFAMLLLLYAPDVHAAGDIIDRGHGLLDFLSHRVGPIIIGIGLIGGAAGMALGIPGAIQKLLAVVVGGVLITSVGSVLAVIQGF